MEEGQWGWCNDNCGFCGGKDLEREITTTEKIGAKSSTGPVVSETEKVSNDPEKSTTSELTIEPITTGCKTEDGRSCIFPFKDGSTEHNECANFLNKYYWCAVTTKEDGTYDEWAKCDKSSCFPDKTCMTTKGQYCIFPFKDGGVEYNSCKPWKSQFWCATSVSEDGSFKTWDYCATDGSCPIDGTKRMIQTNPNRTARLGEGTKCGYNCFINLLKLMEPKPQGMDPFLMRWPSLTDRDNTLSQW